MRFDHTKQSATNAFKTGSKRGIKKTAETTGDLIGNKISDAVATLYDGRNLKKSQKRDHRIIQKQLQISTIKKYLQKSIYLPKKDGKLFRI